MNSYYEKERAIFSERLRLLMKEKGIKQKDLAEAIGVNTSTVSMYVSGNRMPSLNKLNEIASFLGCRVQYLLGFEDHRCEENICEEASENVTEEEHIYKELICQLKCAAQTIIDNAESIIGNEETLIDIDVTIRIRHDEIPTVNIYKDIGVKCF